MLDNTTELITLPEFAEACGHTRQWAWNLVKRGEVKAQRIGRIWVVPKALIEQYKRTADR